jgi:transcriptional regulator with XRE-family HTH domain
LKKVGDTLTKRKYDVAEVTARIRQLKEEKGVTLQEIATGAEIGLSTVKQYMTGKRIPDQFNLKRIADYFGVLDDWIIGKSPYRTIFEQMDAEIGDEGLAEIRKEVAFFDFLEEQFNFSFDLSQYSSDQLGKLESDIRDYIQSRIDQLKKEG